MKGHEWQFAWNAVNRDVLFGEFGVLYHQSSANQSLKRSVAKEQFDLSVKCSTKYFIVRQKPVELVGERSLKQFHSILLNDTFDPHINQVKQSLTQIWNSYLTKRNQPVDC